MVALAHAARLENLFVIGLDERVAERPDLRIGQDSDRRLDTVERHESKRATEAESPVMIPAGSSQRTRARTSKQRTLPGSSGDFNDTCSRLAAAQAGDGPRVRPIGTAIRHRRDIRARIAKSENEGVEDSSGVSGWARQEPGRRPSGERFLMIDEPGADETGVADRVDGRE